LAPRRKPEIGEKIMTLSHEGRKNQKTKIVNPLDTRRKGMKKGQTNEKPMNI